MTTYNVTVFEPFPFAEGQKINIASGPRRGDWEVVAVSERKVKLRCPVSFREFEWDRITERLVAIYQNAVEEHRRGRRHP